MDYTIFKEMIEKDAVIYFDTNCLLSLYKLPESLLDKFIESFGEMNNVIRISNQVQLEFDRNKNEAVTDSKKKLDSTIGNIEKRLIQVSEDLKQHKRNLRRNNFDPNDEKIDEYEMFIQKMIKEIRVELEQKRQTDVSQRNYTRKIDTFIDTIINEENLIQKPAESVRIRQIIDGYVRAKHNYPPGYMDMNKKYHDRKKTAMQKSKGKLSVDDLTDYLGDYFIWCDILADNPECNKIFVTNDLKEDWWKIPQSKKLEEYEPRKELVNEFESINQSKGIGFIPFDLFIYYLSLYFNVDSFESYFLVHGNEYFFSQVQEKLLDSLDDLLDDWILWDSEVSKGLKIQEYSIETQNVDCQYFEIIGSEDLSADGSNTKNIKFIVACYFSAEGTWDVTLGLGKDTFESNRGTFDLAQGEIQVEVIVSFPINAIPTEDLKDLNCVLQDFPTQYCKEKVHTFAPEIFL